MKREAVLILLGLFILGVAGGLERGLIGIGGALIAWGAAAVAITITVLTRGARE